MKSVLVATFFDASLLFQQHARRVDVANHFFQHGATVFDKRQHLIARVQWFVVVGTSYNRYDFDINPNLSTDKMREWARQYYVGSQYKANKYLSFMVDLNMDQTNSYDSISTDLNTNYKAEIWANIIF